MPTNGLDEFDHKIEALKLLVKNYNRAISVIKGNANENDFENYKKVLEDDKKIREGLNAK